MPVDDVNVLVTFYSRSGETERLAVLMAEGAVQAGARIRLRRARDLEDESLIAQDPAWLATRDRMHQEFAAPRPADAQWADVLCFGTPAAPAMLSPEISLVLDRFRRETTLTGKLAAAFTSSYAPRAGSATAVDALHSALLHAGLTVVPPQASFAPEFDDFELARRQGRHIVHIARALKQPLPG